MKTIFHVSVMIMTTCVGVANDVWCVGVTNGSVFAADKHRVVLKAEFPDYIHATFIDVRTCMLCWHVVTYMRVVLACSYVHACCVGM